MSVLQFLRKNKKICLVLGFVLTLGLGFAAGFFVARKTGAASVADFETSYYKDGELGIGFDYITDYDLYSRGQLEQKGLEGLAGLEKKRTPHIYCLVTRSERSKDVAVPYEALEEYIRATLGSEAANLEIEPYKAESYSGAKAVYEFTTLEAGLLKREMIVFATPKHTYSLFCTSFASELKYFEKEFEVFFRSFEGT